MDLIRNIVFSLVFTTMNDKLTDSETNTDFNGCHWNIVLLMYLSYFHSCLAAIDLHIIYFIGTIFIVTFTISIIIAVLIDKINKYLYYKQEPPDESYISFNTGIIIKQCSVANPTDIQTTTTTSTPTTSAPHATAATTSPSPTIFTPTTNVTPPRDTTTPKKECLSVISAKLRPQSDQSTTIDHQHYHETPQKTLLFLFFFLTLCFYNLFWFFHLSSFLSLIF